MGGGVTTRRRMKADRGLVVSGEGSALVGGIVAGLGESWAPGKGVPEEKVTTQERLSGMHPGVHRANATRVNS